MKVECIFDGPVVVDDVRRAPSTALPCGARPLASFGLPDADPEEIARIMALDTWKVARARPVSPRMIEREFQGHLVARDSFDALCKDAERHANHDIFDLLVFGSRHNSTLAVASDTPAM